MAIAAKKTEFQALVNLSVGRVTRGPDGREESAEQVIKGDTVFLTEKEAANLGRFVRPVDQVDEPMPAFTARHVAGPKAAGQPSLAGTAALDLTDKTELITPEDQVAEEDAAIKPE